MNQQRDDVLVCLLCADCHTHEGLVSLSHTVLADFIKCSHVLWKRPTFNLSSSHYLISGISPSLRCRLACQKELNWSSRSKSNHNQSFQFPPLLDAIALSAHLRTMERLVVRQLRSMLGTAMDLLQFAYRQIIFNTIQPSERGRKGQELTKKWLHGQLASSPIGHSMRLPCLRW